MTGPVPFDHGLAAALALAALAAASAIGAILGRSLIGLALGVAVFGAALGGALAALGAPAAGLIAAVALGGAAPLTLLAAIALTGRMARVRKDGPPVASLVVAAALGLSLAWAALDLPRYGGAPSQAAELEAALAPTLLALAAVVVAVVGAYGLMGFGERAQALRTPPPGHTRPARRDRRERDG